MKTIATTIAVLGLHLGSFCQNAGITEQMVNLTNPSECSVQYSEITQSLGSQGPLKCREISIKSLPPVNQAITPLNIEFGLTGSFTFKKDLDISIYDSKDVYIEDMLTGKIFNLKNADQYSFNVNRRVPERFVLHIDNMISRYAISTNMK